MGLLHDLHDRQDQRFLETRADNLDSPRQAIAGLARRHAAAGQAHQGDQERARDPVGVVVELLAVDERREIHLDWKLLDRRLRRDQQIISLEESGKAPEELRALLL